MKNWKRLLAMFLSGAMALSLFACNSGDANASGYPDDSSSGSPDSAASGEPSPSATPEIVADLSQSALEFAVGLSPTDVLLTVNGDEVQASLLCYFLGQACIQTQQYMSSFGMNLTDMPDMAGDLLEQGVQLSLYHTIVRQKAAELGCLPTDAQMEEVKEGLADPQLENLIPLWDLTDEAVQFIFELNPYYENLLNAVTHELSEEELEAYLDEQGEFYVKHILLKTTDDQEQPLDEAAVAEKKQLAEDLLAQLQAAEDMPAKFDELMNEYSEDGGLATNPDGYVFNSEDSLVGGFREAALALEEGQLSGLVETDYGYHIMLRLAFTDEMKESYQTTIRQDDLEEQMNQWMEEAEVVRADALSTLDTLDYYVRLAAYQQALSEQQQADAPLESGGVG